jgi:hypothetical protein
VIHGWAVVDTNVLLVAEGESTYSRACRAECGDILREIQSKHVVVLDSGREILSEYTKRFEGRKGQPGLGFEFWKWLLNARLSHQRCDQVKITKHENKGYEEFPDHVDLANFDPSDRKFVAVAAAHGKNPKIVQAGDSKWWGWKAALSDCGIELELPCEAELKAKWKAKSGKHA